MALCDLAVVEPVTAEANVVVDAASSVEEGKVVVAAAEVTVSVEAARAGEEATAMVMAAELNMLAEFQGSREGGGGGGDCGGDNG